VSTTDDEEEDTTLHIANKRPEVATLTKSKQQGGAAGVSIEELQGWLHKLAHPASSPHKEWAKRWIVTKTNYESSAQPVYSINEYLPKGAKGGRGECIQLGNVQSCRADSVDRSTAEFEVIENDGRIHRYRCGGMGVLCHDSSIRCMSCRVYSHFFTFSCCASKGGYQRRSG
jgi:hypothetical protein